MKILLIYLIAAFARVTVCQPVVTIWVATVTVPASSPSEAASMVPQAVNNEIQNSETQRTSSPTTSDTTISTLTSSSSHGSATAHGSTSSQVLPQVTASPNKANEYYEPEVSSSGGIDTDAGASGSGASAFSLSTGGLVAILIVVILVALFGIVSIVLFIVAKRRQWTMRQTLSRASRRLTGRFAQPKTPQAATSADRRSRRTGIRLQSPPRAGVKAVYPPGHKRGLVVDVKDPEKGPKPLDRKAPTNTRPRENTWIQKLWGDGWK